MNRMSDIIYIFCRCVALQFMSTRCVMISFSEIQIFPLNFVLRYGIDTK